MNKELIQKFLNKACWDEQAEVDIEDFISVEKFAQLIVQECIDKCEEVVDGGCGSAEDCVEELKEHFGVEE